MAVILFLDTNVFLHFSPIEDIDWPSVVGATQVEIVIPRIVLRELDIRKDSHRSQRIRERARSVLRKLEGWLSNGPTVLRRDVKVSGYSTLPDQDFTSLGLNPEWNDDFLLATVLTYLEKDPDRTVILVSDDTGLRLRARESGLESIELPEEFRLAEDLDAAEIEIRRLRQELAKLELAQPMLEVEFVTGGVLRRYRIPSPPEDMQINANQRLDELKVEFPDLSGTAALTLTSPQEVDRYMRERGQFLAEYSRYLEMIAAAESEITAFQITLVLNNSGSVPADEIDVHLHFPDGFSVFDSWDEEVPEEPRPPRLPRPIGQLMADEFNRMGAVSRSVGALRVPEAILPVLPTVSSKSSGPRIRRVDSYDVEYSISRLKHGYSEMLDPLFVVFETSDAVKSFHFEFGVTAANLRTPATGELHVVFERGQ